MGADFTAWGFRLVIFTSTKERNLHPQFNWTINKSYQKKINQQHIKNKKCKCPGFDDELWISLISEKNIFLKIEDFLCVLKMVTLWTPVHKMIVFLSKMFQFMEIEGVLCKKGKPFSLFIIRKTDKSQLKFSCLKSTVETLEKSVQCFKVNIKNTRTTSMTRSMYVTIARYENGSKNCPNLLKCSAYQVARIMTVI